MPKNRFTEFVVESMEAEQRLDVFLAQKMSNQHSRAHLQKMIKNGGVLADGKNVTPHYRVKGGERIRVEKLDMPVRKLSWLSASPPLAATWRSCQKPSPRSTARSAS